MSVLSSRVKRGFAGFLAASVVASGALLVGPSLAFAEDTPSIEAPAVSAPNEVELDDLQNPGDGTDAESPETDQSAPSDVAEPEPADESADASNNEAAPGEAGAHEQQTSSETILSPQALDVAPLEAVEPQITLTFEDGTPIDASTPIYAGDNIVVSGSGFDPDGNTGTRPPLSGMKTGVYVVFGNFAENWRPSEGEPSSHRSVATQKWPLPQASYDHINAAHPALAHQIELMSADGTFEFTLTADETLNTPGTYGVFSYTAGGAAANASEEIELRLNYQGERAQVQVFLENGETLAGDTLLKEGDTVVVRGTGFDPAANLATGRPPITAGDPAGVYVVFGEFAEVWQPSAGAPSAQRAVSTQRWALTDATYENIAPNFVPGVSGERILMTDEGTFETTLTLSDIAPEKALDEPGMFGVYTFAAGGAAPNAAEELQVQLNYEPRPTPQLNVYLEDGETLAGEAPLKQGDTVVVRGTGFDPAANLATGRPPITAGDPAGVYVVFGKYPEVWQPSEGVPLADRVGIEQRWALTDVTYENIAPNFVQFVAGERIVMTEEGEFEFELELSDLDLEKTPVDGSRFGVYTYAAGGAAPNAAEELEVLLNYFSAGEEFPAPEDDEDEIAAGGLNWAFVNSWNFYAKNFAAATVSVSNGATLINSATNEVNYVQVEGGDYDPETNLGTIRYQGTVRYVSQLHGFNIALSDPWIEFTSNGTFITAKTSTDDAAGTSSMARVKLAELEAGAPVEGADAEAGLLIWADVLGKVSSTIEPEGWQQYGEDEVAIAPVTFTFGANADIEDEDESGSDGNTGGGDGDTGTEKPVSPPPPATQSPSAGSLTWAISSEFAAYTTGGIGRGSVSSQGVAVSARGYTFPQATGGSWNFATQTGTVQYSGVVTFTAHRGLMTETFANPVISVTSATSGTISVHGETYALDLGSAQRTVGEGGEITFSNVPVNGQVSGGGTSGGGTGGGSFPTDPLTFTVGAVNNANYGNTETLRPQREAAATPPTTEGITIVTPAEELVEGGEIEFTASGFEPGETEILVVIYSEPTVLDENVKADEDGNVRWIGTLPDDMNGDHVITLQGSTDAGAEITILTQEEYDALHTAEMQMRTLASENAEAISDTAGAGGGSDSQWIWWVIALSVIVIAGGAVGVVAAKRRQTA